LGDEVPADEVEPAGAEGLDDHAPVVHGQKHVEDLRVEPRGQLDGNTSRHRASRRAQGSPLGAGSASGRRSSPAALAWAARGQLTLSNASKPVVRVLTARQPRITFRSKATNTPPTPEEAMAKAV